MPLLFLLCVATTSTLTYCGQAHSSQVAWVPQEPPLFPVSVRENIAYGMPACQQPDVEAAAKLANCHDFITKLPQGYDTVLGQNGRTLALTLVHPPVLALALALTLTLALALRP